MRPFLVRADCGYGNDAVMFALEERGQDYLLKLPMRKWAKELVARLSTESGWSDVGQGWYGKSSELQLMGWSRERRVVVMRRRRKAPDDVALPAQTAEGDQLLLGLSEVIESHVRIWEYGVLVTSLEGEWENLTLAQLYRDRGDAENAFDELKNQWGWGGFTTQDLKRTQITARMTALVYNWWSLFVRLIEPMTGREAITSRPLLLTGVARASKHAGSTTLFLNSSHAQTKKIRKKLADLTQFLRKLQSAPHPLPSRLVQCFVLDPKRFCAGRINVVSIGDQKDVIINPGFQCALYAGGCDRWKNRASRCSAAVCSNQYRNLFI